MLQCLDVVQDAAPSQNFQPPPVPSPKDTLPPVAQTPQTPSGPDLVPELMQKPKTGTCVSHVYSNRLKQALSGCMSVPLLPSAFLTLKQVGTLLSSGLHCVH